jgi:hypothetical protein
MPRTARLTDALRTRRAHRAVLFVGSAAALIGAGVATAASASAATVTPPAIKAPASAQAPVLTGKSSGQSPIVTTAAQAPAITPAAGSAQSPVAPTTGAPTTLAPTTGASTTGASTTGASTTRASTTRAHTIAAHTTAATSHTQPQHASAPAKPYEMYDSVTPSAIPSGAPMATYADGPYAASPSQVTGHSSVTWIDTNGSDPRGASVLDVEPGDATPQMAATWAGQHLDAHPHSQAVIYTMLSDWPATQQAISGLPAWQQHNVRYWIADPTGVRHLVPGSSATQWYWGTNYDISTVAPGF